MSTKKPHPLREADADAGCRWLCETAGRRTPRQEEILGEVLSTLPFQGRPMVVPPLPLECVR